MFDFRSQSVQLNQRERDVARAHYGDIMPTIYKRQHSIGGTAIQFARVRQ